MRTQKKWTGLVAIALALCLAFGLSLSSLAATSTGTLTKDEVDLLVNTKTDQSKVTSPFIETAKLAQESVVGVNNYQNARSSLDSFGYGFPFNYDLRPYEQERKAGTGSGTVITTYGHVLTNYHVVEGANRITVTVGERELDAKVIEYSSELDVAVLLVPGLDLPAVQLGDSDAVQVGEYAIVIGNPLGQQFERSVTVGIVSAVSRTMTSTGRDRYGLRTTIENQMIQVDAAISSGNSGGGMFNILGQLQGIPTMKLVDGGGSFFSSGYSVDNIGMCVPINMAKPLIRSALEKYNAEETEAEAAKVRENEAKKAAGKDAPKPRIGVTISSVGAYVRASQGIIPQGALVIEVEKNSPAEKAGLKPGDIIVEADGEVITNHAQLINHFQTLQAGDKVSLKVYRVDGLLAALENPEKLSSLGEGSYQDYTVELLILDKLDM
ncbi:MAG: trypsin-like peptidase domain-containing protein [Bacillota bacterium]|nr:trypsin-like peptidase domain-containing protein [Bacillota bacterium]